MNPRFASAFLAALLLSGCVGSMDAGSPASRAGKAPRFPHGAAGADCFFAQRVDNFEVLDAGNLLVFDGRRRVWHVEIAPSDPDLRHAFGIQFVSGSNTSFGIGGRNNDRICGNPGERLVTRGGSSSGIPSSVVGVYRLDETLQAAVRAHFGQVAPVPAPPKDTAVEELVIDLEEGAAEDLGESSAGASANADGEG